MDFKVNKHGRLYKSGVSLSEDMRNLIISDILSLGGDRITGYFPCYYSEVAQKFKISVPTVTKIWKQYCETNNVGSLKRGGDFSSKLSADDLELIETLKQEKGSISLKEICEILEQIGDVGDDISLSSISRAIKNRLLSGKVYNKKIFAGLIKQSEHPSPGFLK